MASKDLVFRFMALDSGAGREFDKMAGKSASLEKAIGGLGVAFAAAGVAIGVESVKAAAKFQQSMTLIETQAGRSKSTVDAWSKSVLAMSGSVATGPEELAKGLYHLASTGMSAAKTMHALKTAAQGAKLGGADLESVTNALNATIVSGIKGSKDFNSAMGALNATVGAGDMRMQDLADAMGTGVLTTAKNFGVSLNSVGAALAVFGDNNIRGADAATKLQQSITYLEKPAAGADKVLKTIGLTTKQLRTDMGSGGLGKTLTDLHDHLTKAGDTGTKLGPILLDIFGRKPANAINTLLGEYQRFQTKQDEVSKGSKNFASDWTTYTKTFGYSWDRARTSFEAMTIQIGEKLLPDATKAMNWIGTTGVGDLEKFSGWVSRNKTPIEDIAKVLAAIAAFRFASSKLNDVSRLLGVGSRGSGAIGGVLGTAGKPVPVYVTNWTGRGGAPIAGGSGVSTAERVGEGAVAESTAARVATKLGLKGASRLGGPLYLAYLATQGGDQNRAQQNAVRGGGASQSLADLIRSIVVRPGFDLAKASGSEKSDYAAAFRGGGGSTSVNAAAAVSFIQKYGSPAQIAALQKLDSAITGTGKDARSAAQIATAAANREGDAWGGAARTLGASHRRAVNDAIGQLQRIPGAMRILSREANAAGTDIGAMLDAGLTVGIRQGAGKVQIVTRQVINGVVSAAKNEAVITSPSKRTAYLGRMLSEGLALGLRSGKKGVGQATSELMNTVLGNVTGAGSLGNVASMRDSLGASGGTSIKDILAFTHGQVVQDRGFARNLALARKHGLSKSVAQQIAQLGPDQGASLAASIAGASRSQIHQLNRDESAISQAGRTIGGVVSLSDTTIAKLTRGTGLEVASRLPAINRSALDRANGKSILGRS